jgi:hypothetical protein
MVYDGIFGIIYTFAKPARPFFQDLHAGFPQNISRDESFPLDSGGGFAGYVIDDAVDAADFVNYSV